MTLITYPTRVHFADDVLEEALHSELERSGHVAPLLIHAQQPVHAELEDRVRAGLTGACKPKSLMYAGDSDLKAIAKDVISPGFVPDAIIAFGEARAIELARKCRYNFTQRLQKRLPLYAIPGVDGLPGPCRRNLESWRAGLPSVLICDPTITLDADQAQSRRASVLSFVRCCEAYMANAYNPPADGMALDGLNRCVINLPKIGKIAGVDLHRELMAASLNAGLSLEKGIGPALAMSAVLVQSDANLDEADVAGLVLPAVTRVRDVEPDKANALLKVLGQKNETDLDQAMGRVLGSPCKGSSLAVMGVPHELLDDAANAGAGKAGLSFDQARAALETIYE